LSEESLADEAGEAAAENAERDERGVAVHWKLESNLESRIWNLEAFQIRDSRF
jgi:hypothetical protein